MKDLSSLKGMPLQEVKADSQFPRDAKLPRGIPTLGMINGKPTDEVLK